MYRNVQMALGAIFLAMVGMSRLARRFPNVEWLQHFYFEWPPKLSEEQQRKARRRATIHAGMELILLGFGIPLGYLALTVMFFNDFTPTAIVLVCASSLLCIGLGVTAIWRSRR